MGKLITAFVLMAGMLAAMPVLARDSHHYKQGQHKQNHHKQWGQNYYGHRGHGYRGNYRKNHHRGYNNCSSSGYGYAPRHYGNDSHWGVVFRYFD